MHSLSDTGRCYRDSSACGIGFVASRKGVAERALVERAIELCTCFDHRGALGHGAGLMLDIPWPLLLDRFPDHAKNIAQRDVALGMFFLPYDASRARQCVNMVNELALLAGSEVLEWENVPIEPDALPAGATALRTIPHVRQALFRRPTGLSEDGWFACRYLLRLALDNVISAKISDDFYVVSLSNRTVVYKGLAELSRIADLYPDLRDPHFASRFVLFHSRYSTNTTTAWRRAQPFWSIAHNGEIATINGNVAWMRAIGRDLIEKLIDEHPSLAGIARKAGEIIGHGGSDTAMMDDMVIALVGGGMTVPQSLLALMPEAASVLGESRLGNFYQAMNVYLGACDGPAAIVGCDGTQAVAHLDRNGLRPLWITTTKDYAVASSELTGAFPLGDIETQRLLGPGESVVVDLRSGEVQLNAEVHESIAKATFPSPNGRLIAGGELKPEPYEAPDLLRWQTAFGMTAEDVDVVLEPLMETGKPAVGSMGDDSALSALLDTLPRRLEDHFALRFAQETSPPIDPIRDAWVFDASVALGDRGGLWSQATKPVFRYEHRILSEAQVEWLKARPEALVVPLLFDAAAGPDELEEQLARAVANAATHVDDKAVLILSDWGVSEKRAALPILRAVSRLHHLLVQKGVRHRVGILADAGVWDIHHCALLVSVGADAVCPWLGCLTAGEQAGNYLKGIRDGFVEAMSMMGVTPSSAYCGAQLIEAIGLDQAFLDEEFPGVPCHLGGIGKDVLDAEWLSFHASAYAPDLSELVDAGEYRHSKEGRPHFNNAEVVRNLQGASGYAQKIHAAEPGTYAAYKAYSDLIRERKPITALDCIRLKPATSVPIDDVEPEWAIAWRFMAPGMSEGALSEPAHRAIASGMNLLYRYCRLKNGGRLPGIGPIANSGEGGFDKARIGKRDGNRSVQYAGGRFTITPMTAACAAEAEVKFAQGAKPGKGGQLPGKKVSALVAQRRGCEPGFELISPPINHNLYSIEDVKLMVESWRHLNPSVNCALKYVATYGVEMVAMGGVNAGANRLHISDGCGGTGAAKRVDQKHAGVPVVAALPNVQDALVEESKRRLVEISVDGGVQNGEHALKLMLLGADRVGFGTSLLISIGCSMLRKCHLAGPDPRDPSGKKRLGCAPGVATQDPVLVAKFRGEGKHVARFLLFVAREIRELMAEHGIRKLSEVIGRRDRLEKKPDLEGKAALLDLRKVLSAPHDRSPVRDFDLQTRTHMPTLRTESVKLAQRAIDGQNVELSASLTNVDRCVGVGAAGLIARKFGDLGLPKGSLRLRHTGAAGHFYCAYMVNGIDARMEGLVADSCFTASYGGKLVIVPPDGNTRLTVVGNTFGYGARGGRAYIAGRGGNRFGICLRKSHEGSGPRIVVEGVEANAFQYMTGGVALVLGSTGYNLGSGMTGGTVYLLDCDPSRLNVDYVAASELGDEDSALVREMLAEHVSETNSKAAKALLDAFDPSRFSKVATCRVPERIDAPEPASP